MSLDIENKFSLSFWVVKIVKVFMCLSSLVSFIAMRLSSMVYIIVYLMYICIFGVYLVYICKFGIKHNMFVQLGVYYCIFSVYLYIWYIFVNLK